MAAKRFDMYQCQKYLSHNVKSKEENVQFEFMKRLVKKYTLK